VKNEDLTLMALRKAVAEELAVAAEKYADKPVLMSEEVSRQSPP